MKTRTGISRKYIIATSMLFSLLVVLLSVSFLFILKANRSLIEETLIRNNEYLLIEKVRTLVDRLELNPGKTTRELSGRIRELCTGDDAFLYAIVLGKTADENYFEVRDTIPFSKVVNPGVSKKSVVREDKEANYLRQALMKPTIDPKLRETSGIYWQSVYFPYKMNNKSLVLEFLMSSSGTKTAIDEYAAGITKIKRYIIILAIVLIGVVIISGMLFIQNFSILIRNLSRSMRKAARGELDVNLNTAADDELTELAHSFNSLIGEMKELKAKEKIAPELENRDMLGDIFKFGVSLLKENRLDDSIALFKTLTLLKPEGFGGYFNLGVAFAKKGEYGTSIEMFARALQANPQHELTLQYIEKVKRLQLQHGNTDA